MDQLLPCHPQFLLLLLLLLYLQYRWFCGLWGCARVGQKYQKTRKRRRKNKHVRRIQSASATIVLTQVLPPLFYIPPAAGCCVLRPLSPAGRPQQSQQAANITTRGHIENVHIVLSYRPDPLFHPSIHPSRIANTYPIPSIPVGGILHIPAKLLGESWIPPSFLTSPGKGVDWNSGGCRNKTQVSHSTIPGRSARVSNHVRCFHSPHTIHTIWNQTLLLFLPIIFDSQFAHIYIQFD